MRIFHRSFGVEIKDKITSLEPQNGPGRPLGRCYEIHGRKLLLYEIVPDIAGYRAGGDVFLSDQGLLLRGQVHMVLVLQRLGH